MPDEESSELEKMEADITERVFAHARNVLRKVVGRHHHHALTRLLRRDPGAVMTKQSGGGVAVWVVEH